MKYIFLLFIPFLFFSCNTESGETADMILTNGIIYTVDSSFRVTEAVAIKNGIILATGSSEAMASYKGKTTNEIDLEGKTVIPGFIESHAHLLGIGYNALEVDLLGTTSYQAMIDMVAAAAAEKEPGEWILGRGWHQSKWDSIPGTVVKGFPLHDALSKVSPDNPVFLRHASGHAAIANKKAMEMAGISPLARETFARVIEEGGEVITDDLGNPTGIFVEPAAMNLIREIIPPEDRDSNKEALLKGMEVCLANGITSFHDAGSPREVIDLMVDLAKGDSLTIRLYTMLTGWDKELLLEWFEKGFYLDEGRMLDIRSIKLNADGALGSRGAWLIKEYSDRPGHYGFPTLPLDYARELIMLASEAGFQVCSHAIGDKTNRQYLDMYEVAIDSFNIEDHRYRIEHAQHLNPSEIGRFANLGVIPAMQAIHMSSDRPWAIDRLGEKRIKEGAYVWRALLDSGAYIANGTDAPVEPVNPIPSYYASVTRKTLEGTPEEGYEPEQKMTREEALKSYTIWGAYAAFQEDEKGSIESGKLADFTVLSQDIMTIEEDRILDTEVEMTIVGGKIAYRK